MRMNADEERARGGSGGGAWVDGGEDGLHFGAGQGKEALDDGGIELGAAGLDEAALGLFEGEAFAIRARGDHGVEGVNDGDDAGADGDFVAGEAAGVAFAVEGLVVMEDEEADALEAGNLAEDAPAVFGMLFHEGVFVVGEAGGLIEDGVGNADFSDVVEEGGDLDIGEGIVVEAEFAGNVKSPLRKTRAVNAGIEILEIEKLIEGADEGVAEGEGLFFGILDAEGGGGRGRRDAGSGGGGAEERFGERRRGIFRRGRRVVG